MKRPPYANRRIDAKAGKSIGVFDELLRKARNGERPTALQVDVLHGLLNMIADMSAGRKS